MTYKMTSLKGEWIYVSYCLSDHVLTSRASIDIFFFFFFFFFFLERPSLFNFTMVNIRYNACNENKR